MLFLYIYLSVLAARLLAMPSMSVLVLDEHIDDMKHYVDNRHLNWWNIESSGRWTGHNKYTNIEWSKGVDYLLKSFLWPMVLPVTLSYRLLKMPGEALVERRRSTALEKKAQEALEAEGRHEVEKLLGSGA